MPVPVPPASDARAGEPRFSLNEVEAELRSLGKIK